MGYNMFELYNLQGGAFIQYFYLGPTPRVSHSTGLEWGLSIVSKKISSHILIRVPEKKMIQMKRLYWRDILIKCEQGYTTDPVLRRRWPEISNIWNPFSLLARTVGTKLLLKMWFPNRKRLRKKYSSLCFCLPVFSQGLPLAKPRGHGNPGGALCRGYPPGAQNRVERMKNE